MVTNDRPAYIFDRTRYKYDTAVDIHRKEVIPACDFNGVAIHDREQTFRNFDDRDMIARVIAPDSDPC
ncbi:hypothetical protein PENARI_c049G04378 [Penicillium arizonense]|uniref:Uncharacterized protein n=1 Tax=Penicillium arizonense TaxID=1835702 RepID=A0A1F5L2W3_PENAI|nr:hypothetical protein PENARI_c049G04378 [Penicillium arizonense]OGE47319.1 hypothetical protein PENARI_c049G04378 [Penicillium arizonense]